MKRIILTAVAVMAFAFSNAQSTRFGVKAGLNIATIGNDDRANALVGVQLGGFAEIKIAKKFAIQPELLFSMQGAKIDNPGNMNDFDRKLTYINLPVLARYYFTKEWSVEAGPQLGFLVSSQNIENEKSVDVGFNIGGAYNFTDNFSVGIRYTVGLTSVYGYDDDYYYDGYGYYDNRYTNNVLALTAAYKF